MVNMKKFGLITMILLTIITTVNSQGNNYAQNYHKYEGLAVTPPMGWNSWNKFACNVDENLIKEIADAMVSSGMKDAGLDKPATVGAVVTYPRSSRYPSVVLEAGKFINEKNSISVLAGLQEAGWVKGYNGMQGIWIDYANWIITPKMNFHRAAVIFGVGPSALLLQYKKKQT